MPLSVHVLAGLNGILAQCFPQNPEEVHSGSPRGNPANQQIIFITYSLHYKGIKDMVVVSTKGGLHKRHAFLNIGRF
jgi:hypothetical protein